MLDEYENTQIIAHKILKNAILNDEYSHAYLFETNGFQKSNDFIMSFVKSVLCPHKKTNQKDCEDCNQCKIIDSGNFPEIKIINPEGMWIKKEQLQELQSEFNEKALIGNKRVYIINHAERLNKSSANSILKFLEEPENNIIAILVSDNIYSVLETIRSRCQIIRLKKEIQNKELNEVEKLKQIITMNHDDEVEDEKIKTLINKTIEFIKYYEKNHRDTLLYLNKLWHETIKTKEDLYDAFDIMILYYKDLINIKTKRNTEIFQENSYEKCALEQNELIQICKKLNILIEKKNYIKYNVNTNLLMDKLIIDLEGGI